MTSDQPIRLVLDIHGVVFNSGFRRLLSEVARRTTETDHLVEARWSEIRVPFWTGALAEVDFWRALTGEGEPDIVEWRRIHEAGYVALPAARALRWWSRRVPVWALTNHRTEWVRPRLERFDLLDAFEEVLVSDALGAAKPDPAVYDQLTSRLGAGIPPQRTIVVDDQPHNVAAAAAHGFIGVTAGPDDSWVHAIDELLGAGRAR